MGWSGAGSTSSARLPQVFRAQDGPAAFAEPTRVGGLTEVFSHMQTTWEHSLNMLFSLFGFLELFFLPIFPRANLDAGG